MILATHVIISCYGFWLPNDPRGSWSDFVRSWELLIDFGPATRTTLRRSLARDPHDVRDRLAAKDSLHREPVVFTGIQALAVAHGFDEYIRRSRIVVHACSIMPKSSSIAYSNFNPAESLQNHAVDSTE